MIIVISPEQSLPQEITVLHKLFEAGLQYYHFRKPKATLQEHLDYLKKVDSRYHNRIVTHNFHQELTRAFALKGIHLEEARWRALGNTLSTYVKEYRSRDFNVSSSYHEPQDLEGEPVFFDYTILSPVFSAISKSGMKGRGFNVHTINKLIVGMGGINVETTPEAIALGFQGVGALGGVWSAENPVQAFKDMKAAFSRAVAP